MAKRKIKKLPVILTDEEVKAILNEFKESTKTGYRNKTYFLFLIKNGLRSKEAVEIRYEDITTTKDSEGNVARFYRLQSSKNGTQADIPIADSLYERFLEISKMYKHRQHGYIFTPVSGRNPLDKSYFRRIANNIGKKLGIKGGFKLHACRHYFCSTVYRKTGDIKLVQESARHRSLISTTVYTHIQPEAVRKAMELIDF